MGKGTRFTDEDLRKLPPGMVPGTEKLKFQPLKPAAPQGWGNPPIGEKKPRKPPKNEESQRQQAWIKWFMLAYPILWQQRRLHAIPNGGHRDVITASIMKKEGVRRGIWDCNLTVVRNGKGGLWLEVKVEGNDLTDEQEEFYEAHKEEYEFSICYTWEQWRDAIKNYLGY